MEKNSSKITDIIVVFSFLSILLIVISSVIYTIAINKISEGNNEILNQVVVNSIGNTIVDETISNTETKNTTKEDLLNSKEENTEVALNEDKEEDIDVDTSYPNNNNESNEDEEDINIEEETEEENVRELTTSALLSEANQNKSNFSSSIQTILNYTNQYREEANQDAENDISDRSKLVLDSSLSTAASIRALEMAYSDSFSHERPDGRSCFSVLNDLGISSMARAENIAEHYSAESAANGWKNSGSHYKNIINPRFTKTGIGVANYNGTYFWVQIFTD